MIIDFLHVVFVEYGAVWCYIILCCYIYFLFKKIDRIEKHIGLNKESKDKKNI